MLMLVSVTAGLLTLWNLVKLLITFYVNIFIAVILDLRLFAACDD